VGGYKESLAVALCGCLAQEPHHLWDFGSLISRLVINKEEERSQGGTKKAEKQRRRKRELKNQ
jgi:hypothetical protein